MTRRRKPSRKAKAGRVYPNLLAIPKWQPRPPTPEESAELARFPFPPSYFPPGWRWRARPTANPASVKDWLFAAVARRKEAGDIPTGRGGPTLLAKQLAQQMVVDVQAGKCRRAISAKSIRPRLYDFGLWQPK